jgi:hypothetical protein
MLQSGGIRIILIARRQQAPVTLEEIVRVVTGWPASVAGLSGAGLPVWRPFGA